MIMSMTQQVVIPPPPNLVYQVAQTPLPPGQQPQVVVNNTNTNGLSWAKVLAAIGITLIAMVVIADFVIDWVHIKTGATTAELASTEKTIVGKIDSSEKTIVGKTDIIEKKVADLDKNTGEVLKKINDKVDVIDGNVKTVNENVKTVDENLAEAKKDLSKEITDDGDKTRKAVVEESSKVRWSVRRSERRFDDIVGKLDRLEKIRPTINVRVEK